MSDRLEIHFSPLDHALEATTVVLTGDGLTFGKAIDDKILGAIKRAAEAAEFKGKSKSSIEILAPQKLEMSRLIALGAGKTGEASEIDWTLLGGAAVGVIQARKTGKATLIVDVAAHEDMKPAEVAALIAEGAALRHYEFKKYITKKHKEEDSGAEANPNKDGLKKLTILCAEPDKAKAAYAARRAVVNGVYFARDLVNEPANVLGPVEFAEHVEKLKKLGVEVEIFDVPAMTKLKMFSMLAVGQGSERPSRMCVMQWHGAKKKSKPIAFVGKGVVFDTGGISIKQAAGMEDMKGDMGGAAAVVGLMHALAERKANVNAVGLIGCVENMPSHNAMRPGDIVTSRSGQTVEILTTDAEGRLVLADVLWYAQETFKPKLIIDLATLTGAIMVALGKDFAGMFVNDEKLAGELMEASKATGEKLWRMPLDKAYDKMIDSKNCDVKNIGGRWAGACTAAAFINRFIQKDMAWAHLDIAGTAMDSTKNEISPSWASGWGVRLLDRFVADHHEKGEK